METAKPSQANIAIKWALINFIVGVVITYAFQFMAVDQSSAARYLAYIPFIAFLCLSQKEYRDKLSGFMTYGEGFVEGLLFSVFCGIMSAIFVYVYLAILNPQALDQIIAGQHDKMVQQGLSSDQIDTANDITKKYGAILGAVASLFVIPIFGIIVSLISAAIFKKERTLADIESQASDSAV